MEEKQLRIGNLIHVERFGINIPVIIERGSEIDNCKIDNYNPIPLTEEWLVRFGFAWIDFEEENPEFLGFIYRNEILFSSGKSTEFGIVRYKCKTIGYVDIKYVHQLQNIYFALTGQELTLKT